MKKLLIILLMCVIGLGAKGQVSQEAFRQWHGDKYSMFIHFGLYSQLGGVWQGKQVKNGYSEQIQAFAPISKKDYEKIAGQFNPTQFNADSIAVLAKKAGMHSIILTSKHHDGFCLFKTATTSFNSYDATPCKRDFVKEISEAARRHGLRFGLYYSLIDWHYPYASPMSPHNADFITEAHHAFSKAQLKELLTNYGKISELWFDMGANTPAQSKELYELVHQYQPDCMVSGRLGNDQYDFCVMADNDYPDKTLHAPWQSAASMFDETWSYRSWQKRGDVHEKAMEKLRSLINVVSHGGNFLLNIGPKGDGSVVPFEKEVLCEIGAWLKENGDAIYGTEASPFREQFEWGTITRKGKRLNLILSGTYPADGHIRLNIPERTLEKGDGKLATYIQRGNEIDITLPASAYNGETIHVLTLDFDQPVEPRPTNIITGITTLTAANATPNYSYSCFDYYSNYRSTVSYSWNIQQNLLKQMDLIYTEQEVGKTIDLTVDGTTYSVKLDKGNTRSLQTGGVTWGKRYLCGPGSGLFDAPSVLKTDLQNPPARGQQWKETTQEQDEFPANILETYFVMQEIESSRAQKYLIEIGAGNGVEVYLNGRSILKHLNPYRCTFRTEQILLPLEKGKNQIVLRLYNRFEKKTGYLLRPAKEQKVYRQEFNLPEAVSGKSHTLTVRQQGLPSQHTDTELSNLRIRPRKIAL